MSELGSGKPCYRSSHKLLHRALFGCFLHCLWPWFALPYNEEPTHQRAADTASKRPESLGLSVGEREKPRTRGGKQLKASGLTCCFSRRLQSLEGVQSKLGAFIDRKTNSWHALYLRCLSQGCNTRFPTSKAMQAEETF